jgi:hypothetical protein
MTQTAMMAITIPQIIKWKGRTYNEIIAVIKRNKNENLSLNNAFLPNPCKIYRYNLPFNEMLPSGYTNAGLNAGQERTSTRIPSETPGFTNYYATNDPSNCAGLYVQVPYNVPNNTTTEVEPLNDVINTIRRVRSSGMNKEKPQFVSNTKMVNPYSINNKQYLSATVNQECAIYKPNNGQFSQQGGNYILRKSFDINRANNAITCATYSLPLSYAETIKMAVGDTGSAMARHCV